jgi:RND family efflux transporter MFP subunit
MPTARLTTSLLTATAAAIALCGCRPHQDADPRTADRLVQVAVVKQAGSAQSTYTGLVAARVQSDLGFRVPGKVVQRLVDAGQVVKAGQPLMKIDPTDYTHAITARTGELAAARAKWVQAAADERRYRGLTASGAVSQLAYDQAKAEADSAQALLSAAEAQAKVARDQGDYAVLLADADGIVVETLAEPGQVVTPGQTVIRLAHAGPREASVDLPETTRPTLGSAAQVNLYGGARQFSARLRQLSDSADPRTRTYEARFVLDGEGAEAPLGATVQLTLPNPQKAATLEVPIGAIDDEGKGPGVWVLDGTNSTVSYRPVHVEQFGGESALLSDGVQAGERIVAVGGHFVHEGEHVRAIDDKAVMQ